MDYNVFISHSSVNEEQVRPLCAYLEDKGLKCFVSYRDIPSGVSYPGAITRALRESEMLLLVLTKESNESTQVDRELTLANDQKKKMSCFKLDDIPYSDDKAYLMSGVNWLDAFPSPEQHYFELLQDICRQLEREVPKQEETEEDRRERYERQLGGLILSASKGDSEAQFDLGRVYLDGALGLAVDYEEAFRWIMKAAKKGHIEAENHIGVFYSRGIYVEKNEVEAFKWYRLSALSGNEVAQANLARKYYDGDGCEKDITQAIKWWTLAADQGYDNAQYFLANCYLVGDGVEVDYEKAVSLLEKASTQDNDLAQIKLASCYENGYGVEKNMDKCLELLETAANNNSTDAMTELALLFRIGDDIEKDPVKAFYYAKMAADKGDEYGMWLLSNFYQNGVGCDVDTNFFFDYLLKSAEAGYARAQDDIGDIYFFGNAELNIMPDYGKAVDWYQKAYEQDYPDAMVDLGLCHTSYGCLPRDEVKAAELFRKAAEVGNARGQFFLSNEYQQGDGLEQNDVEAFNWCLKSAEQEFLPAMTRLGEYYFYGLGTEQDFAKAVEWLDKAVEDEEALYLSGICYELGYGVERAYNDALIRYYIARQKNKKAEDAFNRLSDYLVKLAEEGDAESQYALGAFYEITEEDNPQKGLSYCRNAAEQGYKKAYNEVAWSLHLLGRYEEALPWAEKAVDSFPEDANMIDTLATVFQGLGRYNEAWNQFVRCLDLKKEQNASEDSIQETVEKMISLEPLVEFDEDEDEIDAD